MRVIAGKFGGRMIHEPRGHKTHPMSEKVRGALFNVLGDVEGLTFLDAYAGSGAISIEAISRGAKSVVAVDKDRSAHDTLDKNVEDFKLRKVIDPVRANVGGWSIHNMEKKFDVVILDPPYDQIKTQTMQTLINRHTKDGGIIALSFPGHEPAPEFDHAQQITQKKYNDAQLVFYRKMS